MNRSFERWLNDNGFGADIYKINAGSQFFEYLYSCGVGKYSKRHTIWLPNWSGTSPTCSPCWIRITSRSGLTRSPHLHRSQRLGGVCRAVSAVFPREPPVWMFRWVGATTRICRSSRWSFPPAIIWDSWPGALSSGSAGMTNPVARASRTWTRSSTRWISSKSWGDQTAPKIGEVEEFKPLNQRSKRP